MNLLSKISCLNKKQRLGIIFQEGDKKFAEEISKCNSSYYKSKLIDILAFEKEEWSYKILKTLVYDEDEIIAEKAVDIIGESFKKEQDFWRLFEEAENTSEFVKSWIIMMTGYIGLQRGIDDDIIIKRFMSLLNMNQDSFYIQLMIYEWLYIMTNHNEYLEKILFGLENDNHEIRYQTLYVLNDIIYDGELSDWEMLGQMQKLLCADRKDELRYNRIFRERIFQYIIEKKGGVDNKNYIYEKENQFFSKIYTAFSECVTVDSLMTYCIFKMYYPVEDKTQEIIELLRKYINRIGDERFLIFAAYVECKFGEEMNNVFLNKLQKKDLQGEGKAITLMLQALWELELNPTVLCNKKALENAENALQYSTNIPRIYDIIAKCTSIETPKYKWAKEKSIELKSKISLDEMDEWAFETLYSYETFLNMTILRKMEEPQYFMLKNTFWNKE